MRSLLILVFVLPAGQACAQVKIPQAVELAHNPWVQEVASL